jgi:hypothetical protein
MEGKGQRRDIWVWGVHGAPWWIIGVLLSTRTSDLIGRMQFATSLVSDSGVRRQRALEDESVL